MGEFASVPTLAERFSVSGIAGCTCEYYLGFNMFINVYLLLSQLLFIQAQMEESDKGM